MGLVCLGDNISDYYVDDRLVYPGGNCVNVAVHARRAALSSGYIGRVGPDSRGDQIRRALESEGVDTRRLMVAEGVTGYAEIHHHDGDRVFGAFHRGVAPFEPAPEDLQLVARAEAVHTSYSSNLTQWLPTLSRLAPVSYDFDKHVENDQASAVLPHVRYAFFSAAHLADDQVIALLTWAVSVGPSIAAATLGPRGAMVTNGTATISVPAPEPTEIIDTLGAGDAFIGSFLAGSLLGLSLRESTRRAVSAATATCTQLGGFGHGRPLEPGVQLHQTANTPHEGALP